MIDWCKFRIIKMTINKTSKVLSAEWQPTTDRFDDLSDKCSYPIEQWYLSLNVAQCFDKQWEKDCSTALINGIPLLNCFSEMIEFSRPTSSFRLSRWTISSESIVQFSINSTERDRSQNHWLTDNYRCSLACGTIRRFTFHFCLTFCDSSVFRFEVNRRRSALGLFHGITGAVIISISMFDQHSFFLNLIFFLID